MVSSFREPHGLGLPHSRPEVVMLGGAVLSAFRLPARLRGRGLWRLWGLCRRGGGGGRCHLVGGAASAVSLGPGPRG